VKVERIMFAKDDSLTKVVELLRELENKANLYVAFLVTVEGLRIATSSDTRIEADELSALAASLLNASMMAVEQLNQGDLEEVIIRGSHGFSIVRRIDEDKLLIAAGFEPEKIGLTLHLMARYVEMFLKIFNEPLEELR
jgi:predicted regulator of Ras-like GTPase activity (Roadblock/LC7/MglB family)